MAERKVLYFDPSKLPKIKQLKEAHSKSDKSEVKKRGVVVRMMLPMSVRCKTCGEFMKIGTKFNMRKEIVETENYLGIHIHRFYWKCKRCAGELTMKTDPKNSDYVCEYGGTRCYEPWRDIRCAEAAKAARKKMEEQGDVMKSLENKTYDSKREMDILDNLEEVRHLNKRHANVDHEKMIENSRRVYLNQLQDDVLERDAKEEFNRHLKRKADIKINEERMTKEEEYSDDETNVQEIKKRDMKSQLKPQITGAIGGLAFKRPTIKFVKKEEPKKEQTFVSNPLDLLGGIDSDDD